MPPKSEAQRRLMQAAAHDPMVAAKTGIPRQVAKEFAASDTGGTLPERKAPKRIRPSRQFSLKGS